MQERRQELQRIEKEMRDSPKEENGLAALLKRLDAIRLMVRQREKYRGGCIIGNLSTALSDTHEGFRRRLAECFDEMPLEFKPHLDAAFKKHRSGQRLETWPLARYIVAIVEGSIMLSRDRQDHKLLERNFDFVKQYLKASLRA